MIDRFTEQAREAIGMAVEAAEELGHSYVGTEHLLIGLLREKAAWRPVCWKTVGCGWKK